MKKLLYIAIISLLVFWKAPSYAADIATYNYLRDMKTSVSDDEIKLIINFSKPLKIIKEPKFYEKSIQFTFDKAYVKPAKRIFAIGDDLIPDAQIYQYNANSVRMRLMIGKQGIQFRDRLIYEKKGANLTIKISKEPEDSVSDLYTDISNLPHFDLKEDTNKPIELFSESEDMAKDDPGKTDEKKNSFFSGENEEKVASNFATPSLFSSSIKTFSALFVVLSLILIIYYFAKKYLMNEGSFLGKDRHVKVLSTSYLAPKKSIYMVEIAGEVLALGVTATNISLLKKIEDKDAIERIKNAKEKPLLKPLLKRSTRKSSISFSFGLNKFKKKKDAPSNSAFSKQLDKYISKQEPANNNDGSMKVLNSLIQKKIEKLKTA